MITVNEGLRLRSVSLQFGGVTALRDINLAMRPGSLHRITGGNGAGKTSLLDVVSGFESASVGAVVTLDRTVLTGLPRSAIASIGVGRTFQRLGPPVNLTVSECLQLVPAGERRRLAISFANDSGLDAYRTSYVTELSNGLRKRLKFACALGVATRVLLLDEPFAGLDLPSTQLMTTVIRRRCESGVTVVVVEHSIRAGFLNCTEWRLDAGRLIRHAN